MKERLRAVLVPEMLATDIAEYLGQYPNPNPNPNPRPNPNQKPKNQKSKIKNQKPKTKNQTLILTLILILTLVRKGMPFRETHHIAGAAVKLAETKGVPLDQLTLADLQTLNPLFAEDVMLLWSYENSAQSRNSAGGSSKERVLEQVCEGLGNGSLWPVFLHSSGVFFLGAKCRGTRHQTCEGSRHFCLTVALPPMFADCVGAATCDGHPQGMKEVRDRVGRERGGRETWRSAQRVCSSVEG